MGAAAFLMSEERQRVINFSTPIDLQPYTFMYARPQEKSRVLLFIQPFTNLVIILYCCMTLQAIVIVKGYG